MPINQITWLKISDQKSDGVQGMEYYKALLKTENGKHVSLKGYHIAWNILAIIRTR